MFSRSEFSRHPAKHGKTFTIFYLWSSKDHSLERNLCSCSSQMVYKPKKFVPTG